MVSHRLGRPRSPDPQQATHLLTDGEALLVPENNPGVNLSLAHHLRMKPVEISSIRTIQNALLGGRPLQLLNVRLPAHPAFLSPHNIHPAQS